MKFLWLLLALFPLTANAVDVYVATTGSDAGAGTIGDPFETIEHAFGVVNASDNIFIRTGTYVENISSFDYTITGGSDEGTRLTVGAYNNEVVVIQPSGGERVLFLERSVSSWITFNDLIFDGTSISGDGIKITHTTPPTNASNHIRLQDCTIRNAPGNGILITGDSGSGAFVTHNELLRLNVHNNGGTEPTNQIHGLYISSDNNTVTGGRYHDNASSGIQIYGGAGGIDNNVVTGALVYNNSRNTLSDSSGITLGTGEDNVATGNAIFNNDYGVLVFSEPGEGAVDTIVTGNCIWSNSIDDTPLESGAGTPSGSVLTPNREAPCPAFSGATTSGTTIR